jgi:hypothetical protein
MVRVRRDKPKEKEEPKKKAKLSQFLNKKAEGRQNKYVFKGFYDKLSAISGKLGHRGSTGLDYLAIDKLAQRLAGIGYDSDEQQDQESAFIALVQNGPKITALSELKHLYVSYNLVVAKKDEIIEKLLDALEIEDGQAKEPKVAMFILDLFVALIKDMRKFIDFSTLFLDKIFPKVISMITIFDQDLLEKIMQFFSFTFKYMMPTILKNFDKFFQSYFPVLNHNNKFVKKFAAESFSYVLRKAKKEHVPKMINSVCLKPLRKPYKYLELAKNEVHGEADMEIEQIGTTEEDKTPHNSFLYARTNELSDPAFCQFDKELTHNLSQIKVIREIGETKYEYSFDFQAKAQLCATLSTIFTEAAYGVQKGLFTEWKSIISVL